MFQWGMGVTKYWRLTGARCQSLCFFCGSLELDSLLQPHRPQISRCNQIFWVFNSTTQPQEVSVRVKTHWKHTHIHIPGHVTSRLAVLTHTHTSTFTHKVQVSAVETAIGAVLPVGFILFFTVSVFHIYIPRCIHLLSLQSLGGTVLSFRPPPRMAASFPLSTLALSSQRAGQRCHVPPLAFRKHKLASPGAGASADQLTSCWQACASRRRRRTLPRRKLTWTWSNSLAEETLHVPSVPAALAGGVYSWKKKNSWTIFICVSSSFDDISNACFISHESARPHI